MGKLSTAIKAGQTAVELTNNAKTLAGAAQSFKSADKEELGRAAGRHAFNEGADIGKTAGKTWLKTFEVIPRMVCRGLQFLFAIIACGFYGNRVDADRKDGDGYSPEWIFAILIASISAVTAVLFIAAAPLSALPFVGSKLKMCKTYRAFTWDAGLFIAWIVVFGLFAGLFLHRDGDDEEYKGSSTSAMKVAVWVDLVNSLLWLASAIYGCVKTFLGEKVDHITDKAGHKLFTKKQEHTKDNYAESV
ncbi:hypothetical protein jhhlp_004821 [Lomentospora prolificans]|uniref:MARVEL domain-containing protein n=1 Tax=Lomentospora prolificans TaxID=41688 RepID=A0A2N3N8K5_9PEZI|nr:hypothetical protein jhhlp_004821 [Lomentospora prolificans]